MTNLQNNPTEGWRPVPAACFAQFVAHVRRASGQCAKPSPFKVSRTLHAAYSRIGPRDAHGGPQILKPQQRPLDCAVTAQIAHRKYAAQYAWLVRIWARTDNRFALRFAPSYANLVRTRPPACYQKLWLPGAGFHCGFQGFAVVSTGYLARHRPTHDAGSTGRRARSAPALNVEFNSPCRSQHAGAGIYFDHALTECETGIRPEPRRVGV